MLAIKVFYTEYSEYPLQQSGKQEDVLVSAENQRALYFVLRAMEAGPEIQNRKGIVYFEGREVGGGAAKSGFAKDGTYYDRWGNAYQFVIDANYDGVVTIPSQWKRPDSGKEIRTGVIGFSPGKTDNPNDDITTW